MSRVNSPPAITSGRWHGTQRLSKWSRWIDSLGTEPAAASLTGLWTEGSKTLMIWPSTSKQWGMYMTLRNTVPRISAIVVLPLPAGP